MLTFCTAVLGGSAYLLYSRPVVVVLTFYTAVLGWQCLPSIQPSWGGSAYLLYSRPVVVVLTFCTAVLGWQCLPSVQPSWGGSAYLLYSRPAVVVLTFYTAVLGWQCLPSVQPSWGGSVVPLIRFLLQANASNFCFVGTAILKIVCLQASYKRFQYITCIENARKTAGFQCKFTNTGPFNRQLSDQAYAAICFHHLIRTGRTGCSNKNTEMSHEQTSHNSSSLLVCISHVQLRDIYHTIITKIGNNRKHGNHSRNKILHCQGNQVASYHTHANQYTSATLFLGRFGIVFFNTLYLKHLSYQILLIVITNNFACCVNGP